jgi:outer membrane protein
MKTIALRWLTAAALSIACAAPVAAQDLKIGYVNSERVLREATPAKAAQSKLEAEFSKRERDLNDIGVKLKAAADKLDKDGPTLSEAERARRQRDLVEQDRDLQRKRREFQEDLNQRRNEELAGVVERANRKRWCSPARASTSPTRSSRSSTTTRRRPRQANDARRGSSRCSRASLNSAGDWAASSSAMAN